MSTTSTTTISTKESIQKLRVSSRKHAKQIEANIQSIDAHESRLDDIELKLGELTEQLDSNNVKEFRKELRKEVLHELGLRVLQMEMKLEKIAKTPAATAAATAAATTTATPEQEDNRMQAPGTIMMQPAKIASAQKSNWMRWAIPVLVGFLGFIGGIWLGAASASEPVGYVGMSESGAKIVLAPVPKDSAVPGFMWKHGDTRTDPITGNQLKLTVQNWVPVKQEPTRTATPRARKTSLPDWMLDSVPAN